MNMTQFLLPRETPEDHDALLQLEIENAVFMERCRWREVLSWVSEQWHVDLGEYGEAVRLLGSTNMTASEIIAIVVSPARRGLAPKTEGDPQ
ncbi:MAG: hypothetical protein WDN46_24165 [Methylocella sp.]